MKQAYLPAFLDGIPGVLPPPRARETASRSTMPANDHGHAALAARLAAVVSAKRRAK